MSPHHQLIRIPYLELLVARASGENPSIVWIPPDHRDGVRRIVHIAPVRVKTENNSSDKVQDHVRRVKRSPTFRKC